MHRNADNSTYCFSCTTYTPPSGEKITREQASKPIVIPNSAPSGIPDRGIALVTAKKYGVIAGGDSIYFPYGDGSVKVRKLAEKAFYWQGKPEKCGLFGEELFSGGKTITITEGEIDALSAYQTFQAPVVSVPNGAGNALRDCKRSFEFLDKFSKVLIMFDSDEAGREAAQKVAELFAGKSYVVDLKDYKDANEYVMKGDTEQLKRAWWDAKFYRPDCVISGEALHSEVMKPLSLPIARWPFDGLNLKTYAIRSGEIVTLVAGTGVGKSTFLKQAVDHIRKTSTMRIGIASLEEDASVAAQSLMSIHAGKPFHLLTRRQMMDWGLNDPDNIIRAPHLVDEVTDAEKEQAFRDVFGDDRISFYQAKGSLTVDDVINNLRFMVKAEDCGIIVLDHISILVGMQQSKNMANEREAIDACMHKLRSLVEQTGVTVLLVSHLSRGDSSAIPHEEGGRARTSQFRGSQSIAQLSNIAIALERNNQADDETERNTTTVRVLKNRFSGTTGVACRIRWIEHANTLIEVDEEMEEAL
jgi:twinkle protein